jgi:hypothetical protein
VIIVTPQPFYPDEEFPALTGQDARFIPEPVFGGDEKKNFNLEL